MIKKIIKGICTANVSNEDYKIAHDDIYKNNIMMLRILSSIATAIFVVCTILGFFVENMNSKLVMYVAGLILTLSVLMVAFFVKNIKVTSFFMAFFDVMLLAVGLLITLVSAPEQLTVTLIPVALLIPLFFDVKPYKFWMIEIFTILIYVICAPIVKPAEILALDMVDVIAFSIAGCLIGTFITKVKIERYVYAREIRRIAIFDGMTGCYNRFAYNEFIEDKNNKLSDKFTAIMIDINGLKGVNDTLGHKAGDEMIISVASAMKFVFEKYGKCYRIGGDEFVVFVEADSTKLDELFKTLRKILAENDGEYVKEITVSIGYATVKECDKDDMDTLMNKADEKMYADKQTYYIRTGKDRRV